jgi:hypothetical protein
MKIYVASSWRNKHQPQVVDALRQIGHDVYDFRNPPGQTGFGWHQIDESWTLWTVEQFRESLYHPVADSGFNSDFEAMKWADCCVLVLPCNRSAHTEMGWFVGAGKITYCLVQDYDEPELMYKMFDYIVSSIPELINHISSPQ